MKDKDVLDCYDGGADNTFIGNTVRIRLVVSAVMVGYISLSERDTNLIGPRSTNKPAKNTSNLP